MIILVLSCDKNTDLFEPFHHCMEKYWPNHPEVIYWTGTVTNSYYRTITEPCDLSEWTDGLKRALDRIDDSQILLMIDDCFIRRPVDTRRIAQISKRLEQNQQNGGNIALYNFEKSWDVNDIYDGTDWKLRPHGSEYEVSILCGLWDKQKLRKVIEPTSNPWDVEYNQNNCGFFYYINAGDFIIDWGYRTFKPCNLVRGKWSPEVVEFFDSEGIQIDYSIRGFI